MKKYIAVIFLMGITVLQADASRRKARMQRAKIITAIRMSRGACFGHCPVYTLNIKINGDARYEGSSGTEFLGTYQKKYSPSEVAEIFKRALGYRVDTLQNSYYVNISDLPGLDMAFVIDGKEKLIRNARFGPRFVSNYATYIDQVVHVDSSWKKTGEAAPQH